MSGVLIFFFRLLQHRCLSLTGPSVMVDLSSMALVMKDVEDIPTLRPLSDLFLSRRCFDGTRWTIWVLSENSVPRKPNG